MSVRELIKLAKRYRGGIYHRKIIKIYEYYEYLGISNWATQMIKKSGLL